MALFHLGSSEVKLIKGLFN